MKFSIFVVTLNAGDELGQTVSSILNQRNVDFEVIVKDGGSEDGSLEKLPKDERIRIISEKDCGIYDAMNQAKTYATGDFGIYMNCGDSFYCDDVLCKIEEGIRNDYPSFYSGREAVIFYGDCYFESHNYCIQYPAVFDDYACYTTTLCHQATMYSMEVLKNRNFQLEYRFAADCEYYVYAYTHGVPILYLPITIAIYKGGGVSEKNKNRKISLQESKKAIKKHMEPKRYQKTRTKALLRGVGIKQFIGKQGWIYPLYKKVAKAYYSWKKKSI